MRMKLGTAYFTQPKYWAQKNNYDLIGADLRLAVRRIGLNRQGYMSGNLILWIGIKLKIQAPLLAGYVCKKLKR